MGFMDIKPDHSTVPPPAAHKPSLPRSWRSLSQHHVHYLFLHQLLTSLVKSTSLPGDLLMSLLHLLQELQSLPHLLQHASTLVTIFTKLLAVCSTQKSNTNIQQCLHSAPHTLASFPVSLFLFMQKVNKRACYTLYAHHGCRRLVRHSPRILVLGVHVLNTKLVHA